MVLRHSSHHQRMLFCLVQTEACDKEILTCWNSALKKGPLPLCCHSAVSVAFLCSLLQCCSRFVTVGGCWPDSKIRDNRKRCGGRNSSSFLLHFATCLRRNSEATHTFSSVFIFSWEVEAWNERKSSCSINSLAVQSSWGHIKTVFSKEASGVSFLIAPLTMTKEKKTNYSRTTSAKGNKEEYSYYATATEWCCNRRLWFSKPHETGSLLRMHACTKIWCKSFSTQ